MDLKEEIRSLLQKGYSAINDLNKSADMTPKQTLLKKNGLHSQRQAKELIKELHQLVIAFDAHFQTVLQKAVDEKVETLKSHSEEIIQCVDYMSNLCLTAENLVKENNLQVVNSFGPELKADFLKNLKTCRELKMVDYETFTSIDVEVDLSGIFQLPLVNIVSWNRQCLEKQTIHSLGFGNIEKDILSMCQSKQGAKCGHDNDSEYEILNQSNRKSKNEHMQIKKLIHQNVSSKDNQTIIPESPYDEASFSEKPYLLKKEIDETLYPSEPQLYEDVSHGELNSLNSLSKSTRGIINTSSSQPNRSVGHVQNPTCRLGPRCDPTEISTLVVSSNSNNLELARENVPAFQSIKVEASEDDTVKKLEPALQLSLSLSDYPTAAEPNRGNFCEEILRSMKIETETLLQEEPASSEDTFLTVKNAPDTTMQPSGCHSKCASMKMTREAKIISYYNMRPWNSSRIEPLKITFDIRTVMHLRIPPHIFGRHTLTIDGGTNTSFDHPIGVTVTVDGLVVVADTGNHVVKVMKNNTLVLTIGHNDGVSFSRPSAVVTDTEGNIYVKDDRCIQIFDRRGTLLDTIRKSRFNRPYGLALAIHRAEPVLVVLDSIRGKSVVFIYFIREKRLESYIYGPTEELDLPFSKLRFLAVHDNVMLVSDLGASSMYLSFLNGQTLGSFGGFGDGVGDFREPSGITVDAAGNWIVGDSKNNRLQVFSNDGRVLTAITLSAPIRRPSGIHLTSGGLLYVINYLDSVIKVYDLYRSSLWDA